MRISRKMLASIETFFLKPATPLPLAVLRILLSTLLLIQAFVLRDWVTAFLSREGLIQGPLADHLRNPLLPHVGWLANLLEPFNIAEPTVLNAVCGIYLLSVFFLLLGFFTRTAAISTWFLHWVLVVTGYTSAYGVDMYAHVFLFYLVFAPSGKALSIDQLLEKAPLTGAPSSAARLGIRVMQLQLCLSYFFSAFEKSQGVQWRTGEVLWRMFALPFYNSFDMTWLAYWPSLLFIGAWGTIFLEGGFFIFIWPKVTRYPWILGMLGLHIGIATFMSLGLFGALMCILVISTFGIPADPEGRFYAAFDRTFRFETRTPSFRSAPNHN